MINLDLSKAILWGDGALGLLAALVGGWLYVSGLVFFRLGQRHSGGRLPRSENSRAWPTSQRWP